MNSTQNAATINTSNITRSSSEDVPSHFRCPLTLSIFKDPVCLEDGNTYERSDIVKWLQTHNTSPLTNVPLITKTLTPNWTLRSIISSTYPDHVLIIPVQATASIVAPMQPDVEQSIEQSAERITLQATQRATQRTAEREARQAAQLAEQQGEQARILRAFEQSHCRCCKINVCVDDFITDAPYSFTVIYIAARLTNEFCAKFSIKSKVSPPDVNEKVLRCGHLPETKSCRYHPFIDINLNRSTGWTHGKLYINSKCVYTFTNPGEPVSFRMKESSTYPCFDICIDNFVIATTTHLPYYEVKLYNVSDESFIQTIHDSSND
jgi:hypothetical protein